jgi:hypothetical protein
MCASCTVLAGERIKLTDVNAIWRKKKEYACLRYQWQNETGTEDFLLKLFL